MTDNTLLRQGLDILIKAREFGYEIYLCRKCGSYGTFFGDNPCLLAAPVIHEEISCEGLPLPVCQFGCKDPKWERLDEDLVREIVGEVSS